MSNESKRVTLGMNPSTATSRLRKMLLFQLLEKHKENICYRCGQLILNVEELSIDHKKPWLHVSSDLFWDLSNIAFSHLLCNTGFTRTTERKRQACSENIKAYNRIRNGVHNAPDGTAWCAGHRDYLSVELFHSNERNSNGCASYCKECRKTRLD